MGFDNISLKLGKVWVWVYEVGDTFDCVLEVSAFLNKYKSRDTIPRAVIDC